MHPMQPQQQREELLRKEEARREEQDKARIEELLRDFDSLSFYDALEEWEKAPIPQPIRQQIQVTLLRQKEISHQPLPLSRKELSDLRRLSSESARLLGLLRAVDQRGMECPYIHRQKKDILERALEKCEKLRIASNQYMEGKGIVSRLGQLLNMLHIDALRKDVASFKSKLEAVLLMCRHQELAQDLIKLRRVSAEYGIRLPISTPKTPRPQKEGKQTSPQPSSARGFFHFGPPTQGG